MDIPHLLTVTDFCLTVGISRSTWHKLKRESSTPAIITVGGIQRISRIAKEKPATGFGRTVAGLKKVAPHRYPFEPSRPTFSATRTARNKRFTDAPHI